MKEGYKRRSRKALKNLNSNKNSKVEERGIRKLLRKEGWKRGEKRRLRKKVYKGDEKRD